MINYQSRDIKLSLFLLFVGTLVGTLVVSNMGMLYFRQHDYMPAVMIACGKGFSLPATESKATMLIEQFLTLKTDSFDCSQLEDDIQYKDPIGPHQVMHYYRQLLAGTIWKYSGISWRALNPLVGLAYGLTAALAYGIFRIGIGRLLSFIGALLIIVSYTNLYHLRFAMLYPLMAPFSLAVLMILGLMVTRTMKKEFMFFNATALGIIMGVGFGIRTDLLFFLPFSMVVILFFLPDNKPIYEITFKIKVALTVLLFFILAALPVLPTYLSRENPTGIFLLMGLSPKYDRSFGINKTFYKWGIDENDHYQLAYTKFYAENVYHEKIDNFQVSDVNAYATKAFLEVLRDFPSDVLTKVYSSAIRILDLPFLLTEVPVDRIGNTYVMIVHELRNSFFGMLSGTGLVFALITMFLLLSYSIRYGVYYFSSILYLAGFPVLKFDLRHYYYLEVVSWWGILFVLHHSAMAFRSYRRDVDRNDPYALLNIPALLPPKSQLKKGAIIYALVLLMLSLGTYALRSYQHYRVGEMIEGFLGAANEKVKEKYRSSERGKIVLEIPAATSGSVISQANHQHRDISSGMYLHLKYDTSLCRGRSIPITFKYESSGPALDFSETINLNSVDIDKNDSYDIFYPVVNYLDTNRWATFQGIEMLDGDQKCIGSVSILKNLERFKVFPFMVIPSSWKQSMLRYKTLWD